MVNDNGTPSKVRAEAGGCCSCGGTSLELLCQRTGDLSSSILLLIELAPTIAADVIVADTVVEVVEDEFFLYFFW